MVYGETIIGTLGARRSRFVCDARANGRALSVHIRNTGRLEGLVCPGMTASIQLCGAARQTDGTLVAVRCAGVWVNVDSLAPNAAVAQAIESGALAVGASENFALRREVRFANSRFDIMLDEESRRTYVEVKGVTLARGDRALFPDAPTLRGARHMRELSAAVKQGNGAAVVFAVMRADAECFAPNAALDPEFAAALGSAARDGVAVLAAQFAVDANSVSFERLLTAAVE